MLARGIVLSKKGSTMEKTKQEQVALSHLDSGFRKLPVGISSCLMGDSVRYDGGHKFNSNIQQTLSRYFDFQKFCPEVDIGLTVPRTPIQLLRTQSNRIRCVAVDDAERDYTDVLIKSADQQSHWHKKLCAYIFKRGSPSCGVDSVKVHGEGVPVREGEGVYAARLKENFPYLPVEDEARLESIECRENFVQRAFVVGRWYKFVNSGPDLVGMMDFHRKHKPMVLKHDPQGYAELANVLGQSTEDSLEEGANTYLQILMQILELPAK